MSLKPDAKMLAISEQIIDDPATGLTFQFEVLPGNSAPYRLRIFGDVPFGNREILFDQAGAKTGTGTCVSGLCRPAWLHRAEG